MFAHRSYNVAPDIIDAGQGGGGGNIANNGMPIGSVVPFAGATAPTNWLICNGTQARRDLYPDLYSVIGFSYGLDPTTTTATNYFSSYSYTGNTISVSILGTVNTFITAGTIISPTNFSAFTGENLNGSLILVATAPAIGSTGTLTGTFIQPIAGTGAGNGVGLFSADRVSIPLPDLRLSSPVGAQTGTLNLASTGGSATQTLVITNLPPHSHTLWQGGAAASQGSVNTARLGDPNVDSGLATGGNIYAATNTPTSGSRTQQVGQDGTGQTSFSIRNPYVGMNYIIHAKN
jgi:microcystin-dependent protein